ncbi:MAG: hypothetical protein EBR82_17215 [Caulobacteraceae bacterium]|nr:hypothetical protein [Caulobacteraceae bacterium]
MVTLAALAKLELPTGTVRLCDGGLVKWGSETFTARDGVFGTLGAIDALGEGVGDEVPALTMTLLPAGDATPTQLSQPGFQTSRIRLWIAEVDPTTSAVIGTPAPQFDGQLDQTVLRLGKDQRELETTVVSMAERLFNRASGNALSPTFHKSIWSGETGHDQANGLTISVTWGTESVATSGQVPVGRGYFGGNRFQ